MRRRELDPVATLVLLGTVTSILALFLAGDPRVLPIRESFFTGAFGVACLLSLAFPRPIMFFFGRYFMAGKDPQKRDAFNDKGRILSSACAPAHTTFRYAYKARDRTSP